MQVESSASPLLTEEVGQFCQFIPTQLVEIGRIGRKSATILLCVLP